MRREQEAAGILKELVERDRVKPAAIKPTDRFSSVSLSRHFRVPPDQIRARALPIREEMVTVIKAIGVDRIAPDFVESLWSTIFSERWGEMRQQTRVAPAPPLASSADNAIRSGGGPRPRSANNDGAKLWPTRSRRGLLETWPVAFGAIGVAVVFFAVTASAGTFGEFSPSLFAAGTATVLILVALGILHDALKRRLDAYGDEVSASTRAFDAFKARMERSKRVLRQDLIRAKKTAATENAAIRKAIGTVRTEVASLTGALDRRVTRVENAPVPDRGTTSAALVAVEAELQAAGKAIEEAIKRNDDLMVNSAELRQAVENLRAQMGEEKARSDDAITTLRAELRGATEQMATLRQQASDRSTRTASNALGRIPFKVAFPGVVGPNAQGLFVDKGRLAFSPRHGDTDKKVVVNTIPKSGTYLMALLLERLGVIDTKIHLFDTHFHDFRNRSLKEIVSMPSEFNVFVPIDQSSRLIHEGQFAVAHIGYLKENASVLSDFVQLHCVRNLRDVLVSHMRFTLDSRLKTGPSGDWWRGREGYQLLTAYLGGPAKDYIVTRILPMAAWFQKRDVLTLRFEELIGDDGEIAQRNCVEKICDKLELPVPTDILTILQRDVIGKETRTYTGSRSDHRNYWNDEVEEIFRDLGLDRVNAALGYGKG